MFGRGLPLEISACCRVICHVAEISSCWRRFQITELTPVSPPAGCRSDFITVIRQRAVLFLFPLIFFSSLHGQLRLIFTDTL